MCTGSLHSGTAPIASSPLFSLPKAHSDPDREETHFSSSKASDIRSLQATVRFDIRRPREISNGRRRRASTVHHNKDQEGQEDHQQQEARVQGWRRGHRHGDRAEQYVQRWVCAVCCVLCAVCWPRGSPIDQSINQTPSPSAVLPSCELCQCLSDTSLPPPSSLPSTSV